MSHGRPRHAVGDASNTCLNERVSRYQSAVDNFDAALHQHPPPTSGGATPSFFPYVGNGLLAISPDATKERELYLRSPGSDVVALKVGVCLSISSLTRVDEFECTVY